VVILVTLPDQSLGDGDSAVFSCRNIAELVDLEDEANLPLLSGF
jgi:hypothetical protein